MEVVNQEINFKMVVNNKVEVFLDLGVRKAVLVARKEDLVVRDNIWLHKDNVLKDLILYKEANIIKVLS
jgi:hypothetical protein